MELPMAHISLQVNGKARVVDTDPTTPLLYVLRNDLELKGPRFGCGLGQCGACTVIMDGKAIRSCITPEQAAQCGFCMNGILMNAKALLDKNPSPTADDIRTALDPILCRCGSHLRVIRAIQRAAQATAHA